MKRHFRRLPALALCLAAVTTTPAIAHDVASGDITIDHPRARIIVKSRPGAGYMTVRNKGAADRIVGARSPLADRVELHTHETKDGVMRMRQVSDVPVPAKGKVEFAPGGLHLMIFGLKKMPAPGEMLPLTIVFEKTGTIDVEAVIVKPGGGGSHHGGHQGHK